MKFIIVMSASVSRADNRLVSCAADATAWHMT